MKKSIFKNKKILYPIIVLCLALCLTLGYSFLKTTLTINGNTKISKNSWVIYFDNVSIASDSVHNEDPAKEAIITNQEKTNIEFTANLNNPGDFYEFTVYTVNDGSIDAAVSSIEKTELTEEQAKYLTFDVTYDDGSEIKRCDVLKANDRRLVKAVVKFKEGLDINDYPSDGVSLTLSFKINYEQNTECEEVPSNKHKLTINPNGGVYQGRSAPIRVYLSEGDEYTFTEATRNLYNFKYWTIVNPASDGTYTFENNKLTMGQEDIEIQAEWIEGDYVARIMNTYYKTVQEAFDAAGDGWDDNTVHLIQNVAENPINNTSTAFTLNLEGYTLTGSITNSKTGTIDIVNGTVKADQSHDEAVVNYGVLILGEQGLPMLTENNVKLVGNTVGLRNVKTDDNVGEFYFYDGYVEGTVGIVGGYTDKEDKYFVFAEHVSDKDTQRVYLIRNPNRAVAKTTTDGEIYYYNLQDAIKAAEQNKRINPSLTDNDYIVYAIREFEAAYEIEVSNDSRVIFDLSGFDVSLGEEVTNDGYFKVTNTSQDSCKLKVSESITNNNDLVLDNITVNATKDIDIVKNNGDLSLTKTTIQSKGGYGVKNENSGTVTMDGYSVLNSTDSYGLYNTGNNFELGAGTVYGLKNTGNMTITGTTVVHNVNDKYAVENSGTITMTGGEISDTKDKELIHNTGTFNANGGTISAKNTAIKDGTIVVDGGTVTSTNGPTINSLNVTVNSGSITSTEGTAIYSEATNNNNGGKVTINGGTVNGKTYGINSNDITVTGGTVTSDGTAIKDYTYVNTNNPNKVINGKTNITGGTVTGTGNGIISDNFTMSNGSVSSSEGAGVTVNKEGTITGGTIEGETYGVHNKGIITLGDNEGTIVSNNPSIKGESYGLYSEGTEVNFYDGELIGEIDSHYGTITGTPTGGSVFKTEVEIDGTTYQKEYVDNFEPWLQVGSNYYNSLDEASDAVSDGGTIIVTRDVDITFVQTVLGEDKNITLDLNGKTITSTQTIINESILTILDSSTEQTGSINPTRVEGITNNNSLTINGGNYNSTGDISIVNNKDMIINNANVKAVEVAIVNNDSLTINDVTITDTKIGINNGKTLEITGGTITTSNIGINNLNSAESVTISDGTVSGTNYGIYGDYGDITITGGTISSTENNAISSYFGEIDIQGGTITSTNNIAINSHNDITVSGGEITGTVGIKNELYCPNKNVNYNCSYKTVTVNDGHIVGTNGNGINMTGDTTGKLNIYGGTIEGSTDGINTSAEIQIGKDDGNIYIDKPEIIGHTDYGLTTTAYTSFYDGVLKGVTSGYNGLINIIPEASLIENDYDYINKIEYQTNYLIEKGNFLRVGNEEFNSINKAYDAITGTEGTITVIRDAYIDYAQSIPSGKTVTFDLNGHSLIMTQPLKIQGNVTILNDSESGGINNLSANVIENSGTTTIKGGTFNSETKDGIKNIGTLIIDGCTITSDTGYGINNSGTLTVDSGSISTTDKEAIYSTSSVTINDGTIHTINKNAIYINGSSLTVNGGTITSDTSNGIYVINTSNVTINGGEITGYTTGMTTTSSNSNSGKLIINGGHIVSLSDVGLFTYKETEINGGVIEGATFGVSKGSTNALTLGKNDGTINIDSPVLKGDTYGLYITAGNVNFYDGILKGITDRYYGNLNALADHAQVFEDTEVLDKKNFLTAYLIAESDVAININTGVSYGNLQSAINEVETNETIELLTNVPLYYDLTIPNNKTFTLNLKGYTISANKTITNNGNMTITNDAQTEASIKTSGSISIINNKNTLNISNVSLKNTSTSNYVINNEGTLITNNINIDSVSGITNVGTATINNSIVKTSKIAVNNTSTLTINNGTYTGTNYSVYNNSNKVVNITGATLNGVFYNSGTNETICDTCTINSNIQNSTSTLTVSNSNINNSKITNTGTMSLIGSTYTNTIGSTSQSSLDTAISNSSTMIIDNTNILVNKSDVGKHSQAILNTKNLTIQNNSKINIGSLNNTYEYRGITNQGTGDITISESEINVTGGSVAYGIYSNSANAKATILTGKIDVERAVNAYGVYANTGTFEMGHYEGTGGETADVSTTDPLIYVQGDRGIGVKKINGAFNFYDGIIEASKFAKPETTTNVEYQYEVTTYVDENTGFEYALLEYMGHDYQGDTVALLNGVYYSTVQDAIDKCEEGDTIKLLKSVSEDLVIPTGGYVTLDLNKHSITTKLINSGTFNVYNGSLQNFDKNTIINYGTVILGENDGNVSSSNIRIISETTTIVNEGNLIMYDGYIEGTKAVEGEINQIADYSRIRTEQDIQSEKKYLQSLSEEAIRNKETDLIITINPNYGVYDGSKDIREIYKKYEETYTLLTPTKRGCNFLGWEVNDPSVLSGTGTEQDPYVITVGLKDITVTAIWEIDENAVAKIDTDYFLSVQEAFDEAKDGDTIELIKNTAEAESTNTKTVTLDLNDYTITGKVINNGDLTVINGTIENPNGTALENRRNLTIGDNDGEMIEDNVKIIGSDVGLEQSGRFNFYDGYIEGDVALNGKVDKVPQGYFIYNDHNLDKDCQKVYLIGNPENAVAETRVGGTQYFFSLQDAIDTSTKTGYEIFLRRDDFDATYPLSVKEGANIVFNTNGHDFSIGNTITNNGTWKIYNGWTGSTVINSATTINNNGTLILEKVKFHEKNSDNYAVLNNGDLTIKDAEVTSIDNYAIYTNGTVTTEGASRISSDSTYAIYNNQSEPLVLEAGTITGIDNPYELILGGTVVVDTKDNQNLYGVNMHYNQAKLTMNDGTISSYKTAIYSNQDNQNLYGNTIIINDGLVESTNENAIYLRSYTSKNPRYSQYENYPNHLTINGGELRGYQYVVYANNFNYVDINGGKYVSLYQNSGYYSIYCYYSYSCDIENVEIEATGNGIYIYEGSYIEEDVDIRNVTITESKNSGSSGIIINGGSSGIKYYFENVNITGGNQSLRGIELSGGTFTMDNVNIDVLGNGINVSYNAIVNFNSGSIISGNYGVYMSSSSTFNVGDKSLEYSKENPYITGGLYGIYNSSGIVNFYNGLLRGSTYGYVNKLGELRKGTKVVEEIENVPEADIWNTKSTTNYNGNAYSNYAKSGSGYARITYKGETNEVCTNNQIWNYNYSGSTKTFTTPCTGRYVLEVWGSASPSNRSYGGYSYGEIELTENEELYITVGGQGQNKNTLSGSLTVTGGYNGGGDINIDNYSGSNRLYVYGSGGATHIATMPGLLSELSDNKDSVLIVAGGAGSTIQSGNYYIGGSGGGYIGGTPTIYYGSGGTQLEPGYDQSSSTKEGQGSFGRGADSYGNGGNAGGGGWYGGGGTNAVSHYSGGGSGYIANPRIENGIMYGYGVKELIRSYIRNYLEPKDTFLRVEDQYFNSFEDAVAAIDEEGTIYVTKDAELTEQSIIPFGKNITLDIDGHDFVTTQKFINKGTFTLIDGSQDKTGVLTNRVSDFMDSEGTTLIEGVTINLSKNFVNTYKTANVTVKDSTINNAYYLANMASNQTVTFNNVNATTTNYSIYTKGFGSTINIIDSYIKSGTNVIYLYQYNSSTNGGNTLNVKGSNLETNGGSSGIYISNNYSNGTSRDKYTFEDSTITSNTGYGIQFERGNSIVRFTNTDITSKGKAAIYIYTSMDFIYYSGHLKGSPQGVEIYSGDTMNFYGGVIEGTDYGIEIKNNSTVNIGNPEDELNKTSPILIGQKYGISMNSNSNVGFYNGIVKGRTYGYNGQFTNIRPNHDVLEEDDISEEDKKSLTYKTSSASSVAASNVAKYDNGYALIEYIGEDTSTCYTGDQYRFEYIGSEEEFVVPCTGKYKLEVWGAGTPTYTGNSSYVKGAGGYSTGEIELTENEVLYINVGGQGVMASGTNTTAEGGYNGGGSVISKWRYSTTSISGGGATHIATASGLLYELENNKDDILIVAGGAGGGTYYSTSYKIATGGSGGGSVGGSGTSAQENHGTGGTQTEGGYNNLYPELGHGSFGKGADSITIHEDRIYGGAGGGGYYGGGAGATTDQVVTSLTNDYSAGGGGSGYVGNSRLSNAHMTAYNVESNIWITNYLGSNDGFLEVDGVRYDSFEEAIDAIDANGTITVVANATVGHSVTMPAGKNITLDMNNKTIIMNDTINNLTNLLITDSSEAKGGTLKNVKNSVITNSKNLVVEYAKLINTGTSNNPAAVFNNVKDSSLIVRNNAHLEGYYSIYSNVTSNISVTDSKLVANSAYAIYISSNLSTITLTNSELLSAGSVLELTSYQGQNQVIINNCNLISYNGRGIDDNYNSSVDRKNTYTITNSNIQGISNAIYARGSEFNITNTTLKSSSALNDYTLYLGTNAIATISDDSKVINNIGGGIYTDSGINISDTEIESKTYGIYVYKGDVTLNNVDITSTGYENSYGIYAAQYESDIVANNTNITAKDVAVYLGNTQESRKTFTYNSGTMLGEVYGIYQGLEDSLVVIGNENDPVSIENPSIEGGLYSVYKLDGELYFYSGILKGYIKGNPENIDIIREGYEVYETTDGMQLYLQKEKNRNTEDVSESPTPYTAKKGNGYAKITYTENVINIDPDDTIYENVDCNALIGTEYTFAATKSKQVFNSLCSGTYKLEVWGAQGGSSYGTSGRGGYATGVITLGIGDELDVYVGTSGNNGGYNGGGTGPKYKGGGATDIRLTDSLYSRIIVAGGGGGSAGGSGGAGGGTSGIKGNDYGGYSSGASPGTQTNAGSYGGFGYGGSHIGGAGGGGWYGGGAATELSRTPGGGGGSGYVATTTSSKPSGYLVPSKYYLEETSLIDGNNMMPSYNGQYKTRGNSGDGYAKITYIGKRANAKQIEVKLVSSVGTVSESSLLYNRNDTLGDIPAPTVEDTNLIFKGWYEDSKFINKVNSDTVIVNSMTLYAKFEYSSETCVSLLNQEYDFDYTGGMQTFDVMCPGVYKLEVWGAQGGNTEFLENSNTGGYGGYSVGDVSLDRGEKLYIAVGGQGQSASVDVPSTCTSNSCRKVVYSSTYGYNGGGYAAGTLSYNSPNEKNNHVQAGGGGATHIATLNNQLRYLVGAEDSILIVAGGGGGSITSELYPNYSGDGGHGGGLNATQGTAMNGYCENVGLGATKDLPGKYKKCQYASLNSYNQGQMYPAFGIGSNKFNNSSNYYAGGGGGYNGGAAGYYAPAGGGTGYIGSSRLYNKTMYAYQSEDHYTQDYSNIIYLVKTNETIHNKTQDIMYDNMQQAFNEANTDDVIELLEDTTLSYETYIYDGVRLTIDLNGHALKTYKSITNNGDLTITGELVNSKLYSRSSKPSVLNNGVLNITGIEVAGNTAIKNDTNGIMTIDDINLNVENIGITNNGKMTLTNSSIRGDLYGIYSNSSNQEIITNCTLASNQTAYYKYSTERTIITNSNINGRINNARTNAELIINGGSITKFIDNAGNTTIDGATITYQSVTSEDEVAISNTGILTLKNSTITHKNTNNFYELETSIITVLNNGTLISTDNEYTLSHELNNVRNKTLNIIHNQSILNSTGDKFTVYGADWGRAINSDSDNSSTVTNATIKTYDSNNAYGLYSTSGSIRITGGTIESYNSKYAGGVYSLEGSPILNNVSINVHDSEEVTYGFYSEGGEITIETGSIHASGNIAYGAYITRGSVVLGIEDGRGTEAADVSTTNPYIEAIGTTTGIGISQGNGLFKFYDGYIIASTAPRLDGDITTATDKNYQVVTKTDGLTGYNYCILEFMK